MYRYVSAHVQDSIDGGRWRAQDIRDLPVFSLLSTYRGVVVTLENNAVSGPFTVDLSHVRELIIVEPESVTVQQWLDALGETALPFIDGAVEAQNKTAKYNDVFSSGFKAELAFTGGNPLAEVNDIEKDDIMLTKRGADYGLYYRNCLFTVNGYVHRADYDINGLYLKDGGKTFRMQQSNKLGIISFREIGELEFIDIDADMIYTASPTGRLSDGAYIELPVSMEGKIPMMVIGGYLHVLETDYHRINDRVLKVNMHSLPLLQRFYESREQIDLGLVNEVLEHAERNTGLIAVSQLYSNEFIRAYLSMRNSFVVLVDTDNLYLEKHKLGSIKLPGRYFSGQRPVWPMSLDLGRLPEYIATRESDLWTLAIQDNLVTRYLFETKPWKSDLLVDDTPITHNPVYYSQGFLMEIGTSQLTVV